VSADATLYAIPGSHACEAGALMLEHKGIPYRRKDFPPGLHSLAVRLRGGTPPIVARIEDGRLLLDLRSIAPPEDAEIIDALARLTTKTARPTDLRP